MKFFPKEQGCCMILLDVGKTYNHKWTALIYVCEKCKRQYTYKESETILCNEEWFSPIDESESMVAKAAKKIAALFPKKQKTYRGFRRVRIHVPPPFIVDAPEPIIEPKREAAPKRKRESVETSACICL